LHFVGYITSIYTALTPFSLYCWKTF